jgi:hypothetical protein
MFLFFVLFISKNITNFSDPKTPQQKIVRYCENIEYYEIRFEIGEEKVATVSRLFFFSFVATFDNFCPSVRPSVRPSQPKFLDKTNTILLLNSKKSLKMTVSVSAAPNRKTVWLKSMRAMMILGPLILFLPHIREDTSKIANQFKCPE